MANDIMKLMEEVEEMIFTRMKEPIKKLEINEEYKQNNDKFEKNFDEIYKEVGEIMGIEKQHKLEELMCECRTVEEYKQNLHYLLGFLDGIKFSNTLTKIT